MLGLSPAQRTQGEGEQSLAGIVQRTKTFALAEILAPGNLRHLPLPLPPLDCWLRSGQDDS